MTVVRVLILSILAFLAIFSKIFGLRDYADGGEEMENSPEELKRMEEMLSKFERVTDTGTGSLIIGREM